MESKKYLKVRPILKAIGSKCRSNDMFDKKANQFIEKLHNIIVNEIDGYKK